MEWRSRIGLMVARVERNWKANGLQTGTAGLIWKGDYVSGKNMKNAQSGSFESTSIIMTCKNNDLTSIC